MVCLKMNTLCVCVCVYTPVLYIVWMVCLYGIRFMVCLKMNPVY